MKVAFYRIEGSFDESPDGLASSARRLVIEAGYPCRPPGPPAPRPSGPPAFSAQNNQRGGKGLCGGLGTPGGTKPSAGARSSTLIPPVS